MFPTTKEFEILKLNATLNNDLDKYVYLREDEHGRYIEYAFKEGAPHDNRCLSWYDAPHPKAWDRNIKDENSNTYNRQDYIDLWYARLHKVGGLYYLTELACDCQKKHGDDHCSAGHPRSKCVREGWAMHWTYEEPVKCACWCLEEIHDIPERVSISVEKALELKDYLINE